ncbi:MAG: 16S rRNA (cytosine(1402)-N(4))-methyltransferase, partial [Planctomycetaceae bacterium]|nr:16S rRNA (cytosine(1402)-N(4))-methyltransferase [Planctomycetaceae bacterium]
WKTNNKGKRSPNIDPATRTFQALRIAVNDELTALEETLKALPTRMKPGGIVAVISFHSLEDRIVKHVLRQGDCWEIITKKPVIADGDEVERNPRSRSAKLRGARYVKTG